MTKKDKEKWSCMIATAITTAYFLMMVVIGCTTGIEGVFIAILITTGTILTLLIGFVVIFFLSEIIHFVYFENDKKDE